MVMRPPPPKPVNARMQLRVTISVAKPHPRHPMANVVVAIKNRGRRPKMSEMRPYNGWTAVLVTRYEVVSHDAVLAESNSELITAYVAAVMVPSKAFKKTLLMMASWIQRKPLGGFQCSSSLGARRRG